MTSAMDPWTADSIRIADHYLAGAPPEYRHQCAKEILTAIVSHAEAIALSAIGVAAEKLKGTQP